MILVIGGAYSGKREYVVSKLGFSETDISDDINSEASVLDSLQELLRETEEPEPIIPKLLAKKAVICDEVGCGIIPIEQKDRLWRERVGRTCCVLAEHAEAVVRLNCGIAAFIKGEMLPKHPVE